MHKDQTLKVLKPSWNLNFIMKIAYFVAYNYIMSPPLLVQKVTLVSQSLVIWVMVLGCSFTKQSHFFYKQRWAQNMILYYKMCIFHNKISILRWFEHFENLVLVHWIPLFWNGSSSRGFEAGPNLTM